MKKRVLIGINNLYANSVGISLINLLNSFDTMKYEIDLIFVNSQTNVLNQIPKLVNILYSPFTKKNINFFNKLKMFKKYDLGLVYDLGDLELNKIIKFSSKRTALYIHKNLRSIYVVPAQYDEYIATNKVLGFDKLLFANHSLMDAFVKYHPQVKDKSFVVEYLINDKYILNMSKAHIEVAKPNHTTLLVSVGTLNDRAKNFSLMIKMMSNLIKINNHVQLWIFGDGPDLVNIKMQVHQLGLDEYVKLFGFKNNPYPYMALADYILNTSDSFDSSMALIEARVLEKPIITTGIDTVTDNTHIISSDPEKIALDVNNIIMGGIRYTGTNNFWAENQHLLKTIDYIFDKK